MGMSLLRLLLFALAFEVLPYHLLFPRPPILGLVPSTDLFLHLLAAKPTSSRYPFASSERYAAYKKEIESREYGRNLGRNL